LRQLPVRASTGNVTRAVFWNSKPSRGT